MRAMVILLIYDNAVEADEIRPYLPRGGAARVLITSNAYAWRGIAAPIQIGVWPKEVGANFLVARTGRTAEREAAKALSEALGGLPLAHEQAAAYCERLEIPLAEYVRRFAAEPARLLDTEKDAPAEYHDKLTVAKTFALAIEAAATPPLGHPVAEPLIVLCALLAPEPIPLFLFAEAFGKADSPFAGDSLDEAVAALRAFALVDRETIPDERDSTITTDTIRLHRLVREVASVRCDGEMRTTVRSALMRAMVVVYPRDVDDDPSTWPLSRRLDALALALVGDDTVLPEGVEHVALLNRLAAYRTKTLAAYPQARLLHERALAICEKLRGREHPDTASNLNNLATLFRLEGDPAAARALYERALEINEKMLGPEDHNTAVTINNLALALDDQGDIVGARSLLERALALAEKFLGPEHSTTGLRLYNLAGLLRKQQDLIGAQSLLQRSLQIYQKTLDVNHPRTAAVLVNLAEVLINLGNLAEAQPLLERALAIDEAVYGPNHIEVAIDLNNLADLYRRQGALNAAHSLFDRALPIYEEMLGSEHPRTANVRSNLASVIARSR